MKNRIWEYEKKTTDKVYDMILLTDVLLLEWLDEVGDTFVLGDCGDTMCVKRGTIAYVFVCSTEQ